jgi:hypothetical protein
MIASPANTPAAGFRTSKRGISLDMRQAKIGTAGRI